mgnify:CR=1 FL=1
MSLWGRIKSLNISANNFVKVNENENLTSQSSAQIVFENGLESAIADTYIAVINQFFEIS